MAEGKTLQIKRGLASTIGTLSVGELGWTTDTYKLYVGDGSVNHQIGDVVGPASATDAHLAVFDGATGKLIKDGGAVTAAGLALLDDADAAAQRTTLGAAAASTTPVISTGTAAPTTTPAKVGDIFVDTTNRKVYIAKGTASSADWLLLSSGGVVP